jgi:CubicO group peptidase (beta-lactamase class C family)
MYRWEREQVDDEARQAASLIEAVEGARERWNVPGIAAAVWRDGAVESCAAGVTSIETNQPVTPSTLFQIGSITKVFTATLIMRLVDEGRLDLDEPISTYLPDLRLVDAQAQRTITLRHLLTHTSGVEGDLFEDAYGIGDDALTRRLTAFDDFRQLTPPGELWAYCNSGFYLAAAVIERILGMTYEAAVRERVFAPLGLSRSFFFAHEAITFPVAVGHNQAPGAEPEIARPYPLPRFAAAAGAIISTVEDLLRFAAFHLDDGRVDGEQVLSEAAVRLMQTEQVRAANFAAAYGLGWAIFRDDGVKVVGHGGATNGFRASLILIPSERFAVALLANSDRGAHANQQIEEWALAHYLGIERPTPELVRLTDDDLARYAGHYRTRYGRVAVTPRDGGLQADLFTHYPPAPKETAFPPMLLRPTSDQEFVVTEGDDEGSRSDFILNPDGTPRFYRIGGRLAEPTASPEVPAPG